MIEQRAIVVAEALSWQGTAYHHAASVKGAGVDCLTLLAAVFTVTGLLPPIDIPHYPKDFMHHRDTERYLAGLLEYTREVESPEPGDIALWKFGRCFSHAAIVANWPHVIHACAGRNVCQEDVEAAVWLNEISPGQPRPVRFFSVWGR